jgi:hypothetical protein
MASRNQFDLLGDVDNDDPAHLLAAAEKKAAAAPKPAPAPVKLPTKPPPPAQAGEFIVMCIRFQRCGRCLIAIIRF